MKKRCAWLLIAVMVLSLTACGGARRDGKKVGVFYYSFEDAFLSDLRIALNDELTVRRIGYENFDAVNHQDTQYAQVRAAAAEGFDLLIVNIVLSNDPVVAEEILSLAGDIPVIFFNRSIEAPGEGPKVLDENEKALFVGTASGQAGEIQGELIGRYVTQHFDEIDRNGDGELSYAMLKGAEGSTECALRTSESVAGADAALQAAGKKPLRYFDPENSLLYQADPENKWSNTAAKALMAENLGRFHEENGKMIEMVICNNDDMAVGAIAALQEAGFNHGDASRTIPVFGIDATDTARELVREGYMAGTVIQDSSVMALAIGEAADRMIGGTSAPDAASKASEQDPTLSVSPDSPKKVVLSCKAYAD